MPGVGGVPMGGGVGIGGVSAVNAHHQTQGVPISMGVKADPGAGGEKPQAQAPVQASQRASSGGYRY